MTGRDIRAWLGAMYNRLSAWIGIDLITYIALGMLIAMAFEVAFTYALDWISAMEWVWVSMAVVIVIGLGVIVYAICRAITDAIEWAWRYRDEKRGNDR